MDRNRIKRLLREDAPKLVVKKSAKDFINDPDNTIYPIGDGKMGYLKSIIIGYVEEYKKLISDGKNPSGYEKIFKQIKLPKKVWGTPTESLWVSDWKVEILNILKTIDAPDEWKRWVLKLGKITFYARKDIERNGYASERSDADWEKFSDKYRAPWVELMGKVGGNTDHNKADYTYRPQWIEYCKKNGSLVDIDFSETLI